MTPSPDRLSHEALWEEVAAIARQASSVSMDESRLDVLARALVAARPEIRVPFWRDSAGHPDVMPEVNDAAAIQFVFVDMACCFCIWRTGPRGVEAWPCTVGGRALWGAEALAACHRRAIAEGLDLLDPALLRDLTLGDIEYIFRDEADGWTSLQLLEQRLQKYREIGRVLLERYDGHFANLLERAEGGLFRPDGQGIIQQLLLTFPITFGDLPFAKLAMVAAKTLWDRRRVLVPTTSEFERLTKFADLERLEAAADYYIPFFLLRHGVITVSADLLATLTARDHLEAESGPERGIRAVTMVAMRRLQERTGIPMADLDSICWAAGASGCRRCRIGVDPVLVPCAVRSSCLGYQEEPARMAAGWPLVLTTRY